MIANLHDIYFIIEDNRTSNDFFRFFFVSKGNRNILKVVQYEYAGSIDKYRLFNLGFGDYDKETGGILDEEISSNNDQYKVFHTVLNTIPRLFNSYHDVMLMVQGSDSKPEYIDKCKGNCTRRCLDGNCKKAHRRINIYRNYIDKNFDYLIQEYSVLGGTVIENQLFTEPYKKEEKYTMILVCKK